MVDKKNNNFKSYILHQKAAIFYILICFISVCTGCDSREKYEQREWIQADGYRWDRIYPEGSADGFEALTSSKTGITFGNFLDEEKIVENQNLLNGSGVATGDINGDGWVDIYFTSLDGPNKLYKNVGGLEFEDITDLAGVAHESVRSTGAVFADIDGDGDLDLLISAMSKPNALYVNDGSGSFTLKTDSGLQKAKGSMTMALSDIDGDGDLDLYITNYKEKQAKDIFDIRELTIENITQRTDDGFEIRPPYDQHFALLKDEEGYNQRELGEIDELYINQGDGTFQIAKKPDSIFLDKNGNPQGLDLDWGLAARFADMNGDGVQDLYVCNDYWTPDRIWLGRGDGTFQAIDELAVRNTSFYSMAIDFSDINNDGALDYFITEMLGETRQERMRQLVPNDPLYGRRTRDRPQYNRNSFYINRKDTTFAELTYYSGLEATSWSWAAKFIDVDLDGYQDLIVNNGFSYDMQDLDAQNQIREEVMRRAEPIKDYVLRFPRLEHVNKAFRNEGDLTFKDVSSDWGFHEADISHGLATADFDNDGDLDIVINRQNDEAVIYKNLSGAHRIAVRLVGSKPNTQAIGAKVFLNNDGMRQMREISAGGDYLSSSDPMLVFAAPKQDADYELTIHWPSGGKTEFDNIRADRIYEIYQDSVGYNKSPSIENQLLETMFVDVSSRIDHRHIENDFDESIMQDLLPRQLSTLGPGVSWFDVNMDGDEDLIIGGSKGNQTSIFENLGNGNFQQIIRQGISNPLMGDQTSVIGWTSDDSTHLITGLSNYEQASSGFTSGLYWKSSSRKSFAIENNIPGISSSSGPIAAADIDGDLDIDFFIGGRVIRSFYPRDATSRVFINDSGSFTLDDKNADLLTDIGMVTGAVFTDYDLDGDPDLLISRSWDSLVLLENIDGQFFDVSEEVGISNYKGWWNSVATGDFNNDGRPDFVAANWGLNSIYEENRNNPLKIFHGDFDRDNRYEIVEAYFNKDSGHYVPRRALNELIEPLPPVTRYIQTHRDFATATLEEIFRTELVNIPSKEINTLQTMAFISSESGYLATPLPSEAQFAPAMGAVVADFDNDGNEDIYLSQNLFDVPILVPRQDAGRGLLILGDGTGRFESISGNQSGIKVYGQQKGVAVADFDKDGRTDLATSQNEGQTNLYINKTDKEGIYIRLIGPVENTNAIGSSIRLVYQSGEKGPRREIQAGSGYMSQNGFNQVLGNGDHVPKYLEIIWFDGKKKNYDLNDKGLINKIYYE